MPEPQAVAEEPFDFLKEFPFFAFVLREIDELRARLIWCLASVGLVSGLLLSLPSWEDSYILRFSTFLKDALLPAGAKLVFLSPMEPMAQMIKLSLAAGFTLCLPILLWHFLRFTRPALPQGLQGFYVRFIVLACLLFASGLAFSAYFLAPLTFKMLISYGVHAGGEAQITFDRFYGFITVFLVAFALPFEIPLVMGFLQRFNIVSAAWFRSVRFQAWGVVMLISQFVTPDPVVTPLIFTAMGIMLYESGIFLGKYV